MADLDDQIVFLWARLTELEDDAHRAVDASGCGCHPTGIKGWRYSEGDGTVHRGAAGVAGAGDDTALAHGIVLGLAYSLRTELWLFEDHPDFRTAWRAAPKDWRLPPPRKNVRWHPGRTGADMDSGHAITVEVPGR